MMKLASAFGANCSMDQVDLIMTSFKNIFLIYFHYCRLHLSSRPLLKIPSYFLDLLSLISTISNSSLVETRWSNRCNFIDILQRKSGQVFFLLYDIYMIDFKISICYNNHHVIPTPGALQSLYQYGSDTFPRLSCLLL